MEYRALGQAGLQVGVVGLGTEHLEGTQETMDAVLGVAVEAGSNYVDALYIEADYWEAYGAMFRRYRDRLALAVHWGSGPRHDLDYCQRTFAHVLSCVGNDHIEVAMMTMIDDGERQGAAWRERSLEHLCRYREQGQVGLIGGSAHDATIAREAVTRGLLDVLMFPINMLGYDDERNLALYRACAEHGVSLVAMKPFHGGRLLGVDGRPSGITPAQCLEYVFSLPVSVAVPGPRTVHEWRETLRYLEASHEERDYRPILETLHDRLAGQCVYCHHCLPCPEGIEVGWMIWLVDQAAGGDLDQVREWYAGYPVKASACVQCGVCEARCPFGVAAMARIQRASELFEAR